MKRFAVLILPCLLLLTGGCGIGSYFSNERVTVTPYNSNFIWHMKTGRDYVAQGRYELGKEHYLMALASSDDGESREVASQELKAVDMMIQTQR